MLCAQLSHALRLNDGCDWLRLKARALAAIAAFGLTPPSSRKQPLQHEPRPRCQVCRAGLLAHPCPRSVCGLCRAHRDIEVFFKQVKQSLKPGGCLGHDANAIRRQVWTALLVRNDREAVCFEIPAK